MSRIFNISLRDFREKIILHVSARRNDKILPPAQRSNTQLRSKQLAFCPSKQHGESMRFHNNIFYASQTHLNNLCGSPFGGD